MTDANPLVSVGLPVFNGARYIGEALDSLLAQTFRDFEIVISDNASTDETEEICRAYQARDRRIRYHRNERNIGGSPNHNRAFGLSRGRYFMWAADDDRRLPDYLARCVEVLESHEEFVICYTGTYEIDEEGDRVADYGEVPLRVGASTSPSARFRSLIRMEHRVDPIMGLIRSDVLRMTALDGSYADSDRVLLAELGLHGPFHRIDEKLFERREHPGRSVRVYPTRQARIAWSDPSAAGSLVFPHWRQLREYVASVRRTALPAGEKARCMAALVPWFWRYRKRFSYDLKFGAVWLVRRCLKPRRSGKEGVPESALPSREVHGCDH